MTRVQMDFLLRFGAALLAAIILSPIAGALLDDTPFHRVMTRAFLGSLVVAFVVRRGPPAQWPAKVRAMGLRGPDRLRRVAGGTAVALVLFGLLVLVSWLLGGRRPAPGSHELVLPAHVGKALLMGLSVSLFEETLCRGYFKDVWGGPISALVYAAAHYFRPTSGSEPAGPGYDPLLALERLPEMFGGWTDVRNVTLGLLSLFVLGLALNRMRERTGTLYLGIGVHAGLVFAVELYRRWLDSRPDGDPWIFGGPRLHDGVLGTLAIAGLLWLAHAAPLPASWRRRA